MRHRTLQNVVSARCTVLMGCLVILGLGGVGARHSSAGPPNVVLFMADDLGWADVPWHGSEYHLPTLSSLAPESLLLESHYVHPMCSPTRAALLSGRYASRFGCTHAQNERVYPFDTLTLARALRSAGYETALVGKWHLGSKPDWGPNLFGFDHAYGSLAGGCTPYTHRYKEGPFTYTWHRNGELIEEEGQVTALLGREAANWIQSRSLDKPFFLYLPFTAIHVPIGEEQNWLDLNAHLTDPGHRLRGACTTHMDAVIGKVLAAVDQRGVRDNTLVIFLSDNGAHGPSDNQGGAYPGVYGPIKVGNHNLPLRGQKSSVWEGGIRTPALVNWRGHVPAGTTWAPMHAVDWMPTLSALAGVALPDELKLDGQNIWPILSGEMTDPPPRTIYSSGVRFTTAALRHGDWKLIVTYGNRDGTPIAQDVSLFNLRDDLGEARDLASQHPDVVAELRARLEEIQRADKDSLATD